jgi:hypothetical protein
MNKIITIIITILLVSTFIHVVASAQRLKLELDEHQNLLDNSPPDKPIIKVPNNIRVGRVFKISAEFSDPDGDKIYFRFNASFLPTLPNYWFGPIPSDFVYQAWVTYRGPTGAYEIGVQAKDINEAESEWTYVQFNVTKGRSVEPQTNSILNRYLEILSIIKMFLMVFPQ